MRMTKMHQLAPTLPETGAGSQALMMVAGILALTGAAYFLVSNKVVERLS